LRNKNPELYQQMVEITTQITPDEDLIIENRKLTYTFNDVMYDNKLYKNQMTNMQVLLQKMQLELKE
jgi:hypothetical protein